MGNKRGMNLLFPFSFYEECPWSPRALAIPATMVLLRFALSYGSLKMFTTACVPHEA